MPFDPETATFLIAGPVRVHPRVLRAMSTPSLNHRGEYFHGVVQESATSSRSSSGRRGTRSS